MKQRLGEKFIREHFQSHFVNRRARRKSFSSLNAALTSSRQATGRDVVTGDKIPNRWRGSWFGALGYFIVLDQIGSSFKIKGSFVTARGIRSALKSFTDLRNDEINALFALRCSFAHDFSLFNRPDNRPDLWHRFVVTSDEESPLVWLPSDPWDGDILNDNARIYTMVNLAKFGDLSEAVVQKIIELIRRRQIEIRFERGVKELSAKYWNSALNVGGTAQFPPSF